MVKRPVSFKLPNAEIIERGNQGPLNVALGSILTADEYRSAVTSLVSGVEEVTEDNDEMADRMSALRRLLLARYDPPLSLWWTFIAMGKSLWLDRQSKDPVDVGTGNLDCATRVLRSLKSLSAVNASGRTALSAAAPIVGLLYDVAAQLSITVRSQDARQGEAGTGNGNAKKVRKLVRKLKELVKEMIGFTILCHRKDSESFERSFSLPPALNISFEKFPEYLYPSFPLASKTMAKSLSADFANLAVLAEIVSVEVVILQLVVEAINHRILLKKQTTDVSAGQDEFVQRLKNIAVHSVWAASSPPPSEVLLDLLRAKRLPLLDLLDAKEKVLVRGVLFESVLIDAPSSSLFGESHGEAESNSGLDHTSVIFMKKLSVARRAVAFFRSEDERSRLAALLTQMTTWHVPPQLLKWLKSQKKQRLPVIALQGQQALTNWLVNTADKSVFSALLDKSVATWSSGLPSIGSVKHVRVLEVENGDVHSDRDEENIFFVDTVGETQAADLDFTLAAETMKADTDTRKKKKKRKQSKVLYHRHEQSTGTKRPRMKLDDEDQTSSSGSDSEDSEENRSQSTEGNLKMSKRKVVYERATSSEDNDYDSDGALASAHLGSREELSAPEKSGDVTSHQPAELHLPEGNETLKAQTVEKDQVFEMVMSGEAAKEEAVVDEQQAAEGSLLEHEKILCQGTPLVSSRGALSLATASICGKGKEEQDFGLTGRVGPEELTLQSGKEVVNTSASANEVDMQNSATVSQVEAVLLSVGKSARKKKKSKNDEDQRTVVPAGTAGRCKDVPVSTETPNIKLVGSAEATKERKGDVCAEGNISLSTEIQAVEGRVDVQGEVVMDSAHVGTTTNFKESPSSPQNEGSDDHRETRDVAATVQIVCLRNEQEEFPIKSSKKKRMKGSLRDGGQDGQIQIFDTIKQELVTVMGNFSSADLIDALQVEQALPADSELTSQRKRARLGDEGEKTGCTPVNTTNENARTVSVMNLDKTRSANETTQAEKGSPVRKSVKKKKSKVIEDPVIELQSDTIGKSDDGPLSTGTPKRKLVNRDLEANNEGKGDTYVEENILISTEIQDVEARINVQAKVATDTSQKDSPINCELSTASPLRLEEEDRNDFEGIADVSALVQDSSARIVQDDLPIVKSSKKKRTKENPRDKDEGECDQLKIFDAVKLEPVTLSGTFPGGISLPVDQQASSRKMTTRSRGRSRVGGEGDKAGDVERNITEEIVTIAARSPEKTECPDETTQNGNGFDGDITLAVEKAILSVTLTKEILCGPQAEDADACRHAEFEENIPTKGATQADLPLDGAVLETEDTMPPVVQPSMSPTNIAEQTKLQNQGPLTLGLPGTSVGSQSKKTRKETGTPTVRKKRTKGTDVGPSEVVEEMQQPKVEVCEGLNTSSTEMLSGGEAQNEHDVKTPAGNGPILGTQPVTSVKPSSRKQTVKVDISESFGSETTDERLSPRRTRSGRALGTPPPTPTRKGNMRRKLALEPLDE